jgi:purine-binding chemotaxis protein CheW
MMMAQDEIQPIPYLIFTLGPYQYGLPISHVIEVAAMVELVETSGSSPVFLGVANRHGSVLPMLDLHMVFGQARTPIDTTTLFVVAQNGGNQVGLIVGEIQQIVYLEPGKLRQSDNDAKYVQGIITRQERIVQLVALPSLIAEFVPQHMLESSLS